MRSSFHKNAVDNECFFWTFSKFLPRVSIIQVCRKFDENCCKMLEKSENIGSFVIFGHNLRIFSVGKLLFVLHKRYLDDT